MQTNLLRAIRCTFSARKEVHRTRHRQPAFRCLFLHSGPNKNPCKPMVYRDLLLIRLRFGGKKGIRTPETLLRFTRFPGGPVQPLLHLSVRCCKSTQYFRNLQMTAIFSAPKARGETQHPPSRSSTNQRAPARPLPSPASGSGRSSPCNPAQHRPPAPLPAIRSYRI